MDNDYSIVRRVWRIIYPPLIFIIAQIAAGAIGILIGLVTGEINVQDGFVNGTAFDNAEMLGIEIASFMSKYAMLLLLATNLLCVMVFLPIWLKTNRNNEPYRNDKSVIVCLLIIGLFASFNIVQMMIFAFTDVTEYFPSYDEVVQVFQSDSLLMQLIVVGIAAPITEELVFRGILMSRMKWLPPWASVLIQAVIFGAVHMNALQSLYAFAAGVLLGLVFNKFRSVTLVIVGHMAYNLSSVLLSELASQSAAGAILILSLAAFPLCGILTIKHPSARKLLTEHDLLPSPSPPNPPDVDAWLR